ncbi:MAG TPA: TRAP transporter small permease subunit [Nevskiales bacterium]|nr:TRAP transporter small permease subunit [Nevskiales bacterium]
MARLLRLAGLITALNARIGRAVSWLALAMVAIYFAVVLLRYLFSTGSIALQESVTYLHATLFMLAAAWTLIRDGHVRVDIFYSRWGARAKDWADLAGSLLFLLPVALFLFAASLGFVADAWRIREASAQPGGLPYVYLLKTLILVMTAQLVLQALAQALSLVARLRGSRDA